MRTSEQDIQISAVGRSFVVFELDNVDTWDIAPEVLSGSVKLDWVLCIANKGGLAKFMHPHWLPVLLFERGVAVLFVDVPVLGLTGFAAILFKCQ